MSFTLINPHINNINFTSSKKNPDLAAEDVWSKFSKNITEHVPNFYFSIMNKKDNSLYHYNVTENVENQNVKYTISNLKNSNKFDKELLEDYNNMHTEGTKETTRGGGHKHKKSDSSSSSDSSDSSSSSDGYSLGKNSRNSRSSPLLLFNTYPYYDLDVRSFFVPRVVVSDPRIFVTPSIISPSVINMPVPFNISLRPSVGLGLGYGYGF
jgi:hypothetical protein